MNPVILIVDDSSTDQQMVGGLLNQQTQFDVKFAWDGDDALRQLIESRVDVVVTDLIMPGKDGLGLVREMRAHHPQTPVLLMTANKDEEIASEALLRGASSYVPKSQLAERLVVTVTRLVNRAMTDQCRGFAGKRMKAVSYQFELNHDLFMIESVVNTLHRTMSSMSIGEACDRIRACTALEEAISNAILHGNLEIGVEQLASMRRCVNSNELTRLVDVHARQPKYRNRRVELLAELNRDLAKFTVRDQGKGFDKQTHDRHNLRERFDQGKDRGLTLMHSLVDDIQFNEIANEVTLASIHTSGDRQIGNYCSGSC